MDVVRCNKCDKFYDIYEYEICPHCGGKSSKSANNNSKKGFFFKKDSGSLEIGKKRKTEV